MVIRGIDDDYRLAKEWLAELLQQLGLSYSQVVVCAGNHDINRVAVDRITVPTSAETADNYLQADISHDDLRGFAAFTSFCKSAGIAAYRLVGENKNWLVGQTELAGLTIIALVHHPPTWWHEAETTAWNGRPNVMDMLAHHSHLVLTGHTHGEVRKQDRITGAAYHLTGGSAYAGSSHTIFVRLIRVEWLCWANQGPAKRHGQSSCRGCSRQTGSPRSRSACRATFCRCSCN